MKNKEPTQIDEAIIESPPQLNKFRLVSLVHISLLVLITSLVFSNTLENTYHLDSIYRVENNTEINEFWPPARFFTDIRTGSTIPQIAEYRPMMPLTHAVNSEIAKATGTSKLAGFHVGNIAIHIFSAILVYFLFCLLLNNWGRNHLSKNPVIHYRNQAFLAALIFAVHPISGSAVNYIAARDLLLMVFFFIASILIYFGMRTKGDSISGWLASLLLLCLAILSKQAAIMGFGLIFLFEWTLVGLKFWDWRLWARTAMFSLPTVGFFVLRALWLAPQGGGDLRAAKGLTFPFTMLDAHFFYYLRNFVWPFEMRTLAKVEVIESILAPSALIGLLFIVISLIVAWFFRKRQPVITFSILAYWLLFALTASIFPFRYLVTDYRQYLPSIFLCLTVSLVCFTIKPRTLSVFLLTGMTVYFSVSSYQINQNWKTEESFWQQSVKYGAVAIAHQNYGLAVAGKNPELAEFHYLEAIRQSPSNIYANINLGMIHIKMGKTEEGLQRLRKMVAWNSNWALSHYWLSEGLKQTGQKDEALKEVLIAADLDPRSLKYQYAAARELQRADKRKEAIPYFKRVISIDPDYKLAGFWLGFAYQKIGQSQHAIDTYNRFLQNNPDHVQSHFNLAFELQSEKDCKMAVGHFTRVLELQPDYRETHLRLSQCFATLGDSQLAEHHLSIYRTGQKPPSSSNQ